MPNTVSTSISGGAGDALSLVVPARFQLWGSISSANVSEDLWQTGGFYPFPAAAAITSIVSNNAADTAAGTGARTVRVSGLDTNLDIIFEIVTMAGVVPVVLTQQYRRINRTEVITAGSSGSNVGIILVTHPGPVTLAEIEDTGIGIALQAIFTVPRTLVNPRIQSAAIEIFRSTGDGGMQCLMQRRHLLDADLQPFVNGAFGTLFLVSVYADGNTENQFITDEKASPLIRPGDDIRFRIDDTLGTGNKFAGGMTLLYDPPEVAI